MPLEYRTVIYILKFWWNNTKLLIPSFKNYFQGSAEQLSIVYYLKELSAYDNNNKI